MTQPARAVLVVIAVMWLAACGGSDSSTPQSTTNQPPTTAQEPTKPPPTTPTTAPPGPAPGSGSGGGAGGGSGFNQGYGFNGLVRTIVMAQDGTRDLYVGGDFTNYNGTTANRLIRLHQDGRVAQTFGQGFDQSVGMLALATDGGNALYVGGPFTQFDGQAVPQVIRLTSNGLRDVTFQLRGVDLTPVSFLTALAVTEDGSRDVYLAINVVEGVPGTPVDATAGRIVRLNPDGSLNPAFRDVRFPGVPDLKFNMVSTIAVPPGSGKLYVGGSMAVTGAPSSLLRLNADGTIDSTFTTGTGVQGIMGTNAVETITVVADGSGDIYAGGRMAEYNRMPVTFGSIRVHETGALDTTFAPTEPMITFAISPARDGTTDVLMWGLGTRTQDRPSRLLRLNHNGSLSSTFHEPTAEAVWILTIVPAIDGTGDLYIGGQFTTYNGAPANNFARIHADGSLASTGVAFAP